jgi:ParB family transcriptional regulator, chromosome partitioning protein
MAPEKSTRRLGRGLDALFNTPPNVQETAPPSALRDIPLAQIESNPFQPRKTFQKEELAELSESLKTSGLLQPVTVRPSPKGSGYELIAGERRFRAASDLGWESIPAVVKEMNDQEILTLALIENLQRSDLNPIEEAEGYDQLIRDFGHTQQSVATMVGKDRSTVANTLRILQLPQTVRQLIEQGKLTAGQARPLLGLSDEARITQFAKTTVEKGWSAREVERQVRDIEAPAGTRETRRDRPSRTESTSPEVRNLEQRLRKHLQTDVSITLKTTSRGSLAIEFYSADDLERLTQLIGLPDNPQ